MQNILIVSILVLTFTFVSSAQINQALSCPTINVRGGGVPEPNGISYFTADVDKKGKELNVEYIWSVRGGKIFEGQGTETIAVKVSEEHSLTATIEIKGFPEGCPNTSTESLVWDPPPKAVKIGEFLTFDTQTEKTLLKELKNKIIDNPNAQINVIGKFKENTSEKKVNQTLKRLGSFLMKEFTLAPSGITMIRVFGDQEYLEIWLVPPGANNPEVRW